MKDFLRNHGLWILFAGAVIAVALALLSYFSTNASPLVDLANTITSPFRAVCTSVSGWFTDKQNYYEDVTALKAENEALKKQIAEMEATVRQGEAASQENVFLRDLLDLRQQRRDLSDFETATVTERGVTNWTASLTLNKGTAHGVELGDCVIDGNARLVGRSSQQMQNVANNILSAWRSYTDESVGILAETDGTPHNTVTPILHYDETEGYILDLALRNNRTSEEYPDGIFHPHKEYHNIKKENIGLIEVMGLAILPARLKDQGAQIAEILAGQRPNTSREAGDTLAVHADWIDELIAKYGTHMKPQDANKAVKAEIGTVFSHVLENAGVFKQDAAGQAAFVRFMQSVGFKKA